MCPSRCRRPTRMRRAARAASRGASRSSRRSRSRRRARRVVVAAAEAVAAAVRAVARVARARRAVGRRVADRRASARMGRRIEADMMVVDRPMAVAPPARGRLRRARVDIDSPRPVAASHAGGAENRRPAFTESRVARTRGSWAGHRGMEFAPRSDRGERGTQMKRRTAGAQAPAVRVDRDPRLPRAVSRRFHMRRGEARDRRR